LVFRVKNQLEHQVEDSRLKTTVAGVGLPGVEELKIDVWDELNCEVLAQALLQK